MVSFQLTANCARLILSLRDQQSEDYEAGTLAWANGVDFCPDMLYVEATGKSIEELDMRLEVV